MAYLDMHAQVQWMMRDRSNDECEMMNDEPETHTSDFSASSVIVHSSVPLLSPVTSFPSLSGMVFSYCIATLVVGIGLLVAWAWKMPDYPEIARQAQESAEPRFTQRASEAKPCRAHHRAWSIADGRGQGSGAMDQGRAKTTSSLPQADQGTGSRG